MSQEYLVAALGSGQAQAAYGVGAVTLGDK